MSPDDPCDPTPVDDRNRIAYIRALIASRCPELGQSDLALIVDAPPDDSDTAIPAAVADRIMDVLLAFEARLERIENAVRSG
jgi:hypothetical protein